MHLREIRLRPYPLEKFKRIIFYLSNALTNSEDAAFLQFKMIRNGGIIISLNSINSSFRGRFSEEKDPVSSIFLKIVGKNKILEFFQRIEIS